MAQTQFINFGPWAPDRSEFNTPGTEQALNVIRTSNGYRPFPGLVDAGFAALPDGQPTGMFFGKDINGNARQFAAIFTDPNTTGMYELNVGGASWDRVGTWNLTSNNRYREVQFEDDMFITNFSEHLRRITLGTGGDFQKISFVLDDTLYRGPWDALVSYATDDQVHFVSSSAPDAYALYGATAPTTPGQSPDTDPGLWSDISQFVKPKFIATIRDFLVVGGMEDPGDGLHPDRVRWSGINAPLYWSLNGNPDNLSDLQDPPDAGEVRGIVGGEYGTLLMEGGVFRMDFVGPPEVFVFNRIENARGCSESNSVITEGQNTYYLSDDGWAKFDGQQVIPIGAERFDRWFTGVSSIQTRETMSPKVDPGNKLILWGFNSGTDATDLNDTALIYDYVLDEPSYARFPHSLLGDFVSPGYTVEDLTSLVISDPTNYQGVWNALQDYALGDRVSYVNVIWNADTDPAVGDEPGVSPAWSATAITASVDDLPAPTDSAFYKAGVPSFGALKVNVLNTFTGIPEAAQIDTSEQRLGGDKRAKVQMVQTAIEGVAQTITVQIGTRNRQGKPVQFGPAREITADGLYPVLQDSRYQRVRVNITANDEQGWSDATGVFVRAQPTSIR